MEIVLKLKHNLMDLALVQCSCLLRDLPPQVICVFANVRSELKPNEKLFGNVCEHLFI